MTTFKIIPDTTQNSQIGIIPETQSTSVKVVSTTDSANLKVTSNDSNNVQIASTTPDAKVVVVNSGVPGSQGVAGPAGANGAAGQGIATGGTVGQILVKTSSTDYETGWTDQLTQENIQDYVAPLFLHNNHINANVTYEDSVNELHIDVTNAPSAGYTSVVKHSVKLGEAINKGQAVYVSSSNGTNMIVSKASNTAESTSSKTMGLLEANGSANAFVNVIAEGLLAGLDTSTAIAGDPVWLGTGGNLIYGLANKPYAPAHLVFIGIVTRVNQNNGEIFVKVQNGFEVEELHNLLATNKQNNDVLAYDSSTSLWKNKTLTDLDLLTNTNAYSTYGGLSSTNVWTSGNAFTAGEIGIDDSNYSGGGFPLLSISNSTTGVLTQQWNSGVTTVGQIAQDGLATWFAGSTLRNSAATTKNPLLVINNAAAIVPTIIRGASAQTADLLQLQNSSSTILSRISSTGQFVSDQQTYIGSGATSISNARFNVATGSASVIGSVVRGTTSQTANLQEWQLNTGTILAQVDAFGGIRTNSYLQVQSGAATTIPQWIRGASAQTADLLQYQVNGGATVLGGVNAVGQIYAGATPITNYYAGGATTAASGTGTVATITTTSTHGLGVGDIVTISNVTPTGYNGTYPITAVTTNTFSYANTTTGAQTVAGLVSIPPQTSITSRSAATPALVVKSGGYVADVQRWLNSSGGLVAGMNPYGTFYTLASANYFKSDNPSNFIFRTLGAVNQKEDAIQVTDNVGTVRGGINSYGQVYTGALRSGPTYAITAASASSTTVATFTYNSTTQYVTLGHTVTIAGFTTETYYNGSFVVTAIGGTSGAFTFTVVAQTATFTVGSATQFGTFLVPSQLSVTTTSAATPGIVVRGVANQSANLQGWQISDGTETTRIRAGGQLGLGSTITGTTLAVNTDLVGGATSIGAVIRGSSGQSADLTQWQDSTGAIKAKVSAAGNMTIGPLLTFNDPGVGNPTTFSFLKNSDQAWLKVTERVADATTYEFGMADNPDGSDYFQWRWDDWQNASTGWMPLQMTAFTNRFIGRNNSVYGNLQLPYNSGFYTYNNTANTNDIEVNKYYPNNSTSQQITKDSGTGTGTLTVDATSYTGTGATVYWIAIDGTGTFKWGNGSWSGTAVASGVVITGTAQTLSNGLTVTLSTTGQVLGDRWSVRAYPPPQFAIGGGALGSVTSSILPKSNYIGQVIRAASGQSANLQEWQDSSGNILKRLDNAANTYNSNRMFIGTQAYTSNTLLVQSIGGTTETTAVIRAKTSQTGNLQEWQSNTGGILSYVDVSGNIWSPANTVPTQTSWTGAVSLTQAETINTYIPKLLTGNTTVTLPSGVSGKRYECHLELQQDATGSRTIILKGARTAYGVALVLTTTASAIDIVRLEWNGTYWTAFMGAPQVSVPAAWV